MIQPPETTTDRATARWQFALSAIVLSALAMPVVMADLAVRNDQFLLRRRAAEWKRTNGMYRDSRFYVDPEMRLLNDELQRVDYSRGGVYVVGSSAMQTSIAVWDLPPAEQRFIHNYSISGATYTQQFQFIRYLVEDEGLLRAGGDKTIFIIGLSFPSGSHRETLKPKSLFRSFFGRDPMYSYDVEHGLRRVPMSPVQRRLRVEEVRNQAFWTWLKNVINDRDLDYMRPIVHQPDNVTRDFWLDWLGGPGWEQGMDLEIEELGHLIDYLLARNVRVETVYLPEGSWFKGFAPVTRHRTSVLEMLSRKSVPLLDFADRLPDDQFADSVHLTYAASQQVERRVFDVARSHLQVKGLLAGTIAR